MFMVFLSMFRFLNGFHSYGSIRLLRNHSPRTGLNQNFKINEQLYFDAFKMIGCNSNPFVVSVLRDLSSKMYRTIRTPNLSLLTSVIIIYKTAHINLCST